MIVALAGASTIMPHGRAFPQILCSLPTQQPHFHGRRDRSERSGEGGHQGPPQPSGPSERARGKSNKNLTQRGASGAGAPVTAGMASSPSHSPSSGAAALAAASPNSAATQRRGCIEQALDSVLSVRCSLPVLLLPAKKATSTPHVNGTDSDSRKSCCRR